MLRETVAAIVMAVFAGVPALAQDADFITYPATSFLDWTQNPQRDLQDQAVGQYNFEAGLLGIVTRAADRYPGIFLGPQDQASVERELQATDDALLHNRPKLPYDQAGGDAGNPKFMPDWNHDGVFGDPADFDADTDGDPHGTTPDALDTAYFLYPCANPDNTVYYVDTSGICVPPGQSASAYKHGVARELKIVNARGLVLDATLWIPGEAFAAVNTCPKLGAANYSSRDAWKDCVRPSNFAGGSFPGVVFSNGLSSRQEHYYWFAMRMAREGFIVLTHDPAGQGESEGTWTDLIDFFNQSPEAVSASTGACQFKGACRDTEDMVRWFVGEPVTSVVAELNDKALRIAPRRSPSENAPNPVLPILDSRRVAIAGNSMGALGTVHYLLDLGNGAGFDGRPLPSIAAAVSLSGAAPTHAIVPIQFQTSDYDGSPLLVGPTVLGANLGEQGSGIGYKLIKQRYNQLRDDLSDRTAPMELVILEGGVHTDHVDVPFVPRTDWANSVASDYAADWLKCYAAGDFSACPGAVSDRPHISRAFASEQVAPGTASSECIRVPDRASLNQPPADFLAAYTGKHVCDCSGTTDGRTCDTALTLSP